MDTLRVLITGGGAPGIRGTLYSLKHNYDGRRVETVCVDMKEDVVGRYLCDKFYAVPPGTSEEFVPALLNVCEKEKIDVVLPQVTAELFPLTQNRKKFESLGTCIAISDYSAINVANNKYKLMEVAKKINLAYPEFYLVQDWDSLVRSAEKLGYPFAIKPPIASGMRGFRIIYHEIDRKNSFFRNKPDNTKITLDDLHIIIGDEFPPLLVMEYLPGREYTVDILSSKDRVYAVIPRRRDQIRTGITFVGTVEKRNDIIINAEKLTVEIGLQFAHGMQFKEDKDGVPKIIEANPRIQGTMVLSTIAGANIIYSAVKLALGEEIPEFNIHWGARLLRYWGGIGIADRVIEI